MSGSAAFLDPDILTVPESDCGQAILSMIEGLSVPSMDKVSDRYSIDSPETCKCIPRDSLVRTYIVS